MNNILNSNNKKANKVSIFFLFFIAIGIVVYLFPTQGQFKFEYQKGTPWQHDDLIAPFDFAIYKAEADLKAERDSALKSFKPYFVFDFEVGKQELEKFNANFDARYSNSLEIVKKLYPNFTESQSAKDDALKVASEMLSFVFDKGVVNFNDILEYTKQGSSIVVLKDKVAETRDVEEVFTQKIAYSYINKRLDTDFENRREFAALIENLKLYDYVAQNLTYDAETSEKVKNQIVSSISPTRGMVQAGERIIAKGDVIHNANYLVLESLRREYETILGSNTGGRLLFYGQAIMILICFGLLYLFLHHFRPEILQSFLKTLFILMLVLMLVIAAILVERFNLISIYLIPFVAVPIIIRAFYDSRLAFFIHLVTIMMSGFVAPNSFEFLFLHYVAGAVAIFSIRQLHRRGQLFYAVGYIVLSYCLAYFAMALMQEESLRTINYNNFLYFIGNGLLLLATYPIVFLFEKIFGFLSDVTLLELSDTNHPALRELAETAPGTFQHVMQVANLAEEAVRKIGGNALLMRVGALYHDIGKTGAPRFFVENQSGKNPHEKLAYDKSAEVIIQHVYYGVELAHKYKLPQPIIDFITTHHGTGVVKYFYTKYANENEGAVPDISKFSYPGPSPFTKETAVLMMADAVEAASRTLKEYNENSIDQLVEKIVDNQMADNQFEEADITFKQIHTVKEVFKKKLLNIYHARIEYPEPIK